MTIKPAGSLAFAPNYAADEPVSDVRRGSDDRSLGSRKHQPDVPGACRAGPTVPRGGRGCGAAWVWPTPSLIADPVSGTQTVSDERAAPSRDGRYLLCGYVQEGLGDTVAEATASGTFAVGPDPCVVAKAALARAQKAVKVAESAVVRYRKLLKRSHGRAKVRRYRSRYKSAVRTRSKERKALGTARAGVAAVCPGG